MELKELVSKLTYDRLSRGLLIGGTAAFLYLLYELCLRNKVVKETDIAETSSSTDYTTYFKEIGGV